MSVVGRRRVVVTGLGIISPIGSTVEKAWRALLAGQSGIQTVTGYDLSAFSTQIAGQVTDFEPTLYDITSKEERKMDPFIQYGIAASHQAVVDSGLLSQLDSINLDRCGVSVGSGIGGLTFIQKNVETLNESGPRRVSPFFIPGAIINMISGYASIRYGFRGPNLAFATACTTGSHSIGIAARSIAYGDADVMLAGGSEKGITPLGVAGFAAARALSTRNDDPQKASRPFDADRDGFVLGDGSGVLVLEEYEHAKKRGAKIYAELAGFGMSGDANHITQPAEGGAGGAACMRLAMQDAGLTPDDIDYINAHGTSTPIGDMAETMAIKAALGDRAYKVAVSSNKSMIGHLLGAAGAVEAIFSILTLRDQIVPPTINLENPSEGCDLDYVPHTAREMSVRACISNSFGFGGTNGALLFRKI
ncbi:MAG: beta-ketoacyl-ACP synthase II [Gammaproteobacteria bacterium]